MLSTALWALGSGLLTMATTITLAEWATRVQYLGVMGTVHFWGVFALTYSPYAHWLTRRLFVGLAIVPLFFYIIMFTSPWHGGFQRADEIIDVNGYSFVTFELDIWFWAWSVYAYGIFIGGAVLLLRSMWRYPHLYRGQVAAILLGIFTPALLNVLHVYFGAQILGPYDPTAIGYSIAGILFLIAIKRYRFLDITPVAHDLVFRSVDSGVIVLDEHGLVTDANPKAVAILRSTSGDLINQPLKDVFAEHEPLISRPGTALEVRTDITLHGQHYELQLQPLRNRQGSIVGRVIMLYDITVQKQSMLELAQRDAILATLVDGAEVLLQNPEWRQTLPDLLAQLGNAAAASRVYVFEKHPNTTPAESIVSQRFEWVAPGIKAEIDNPGLQHLAFRDAFPRWVEFFERGESVQGQVKDFPDSERAILEPQNIVSIVMTPIMVNDDWWGFIGFDECKGERVWSAAEMRALRSAASSLGAAIGRQAAEQERESLIVELEAARAAAEENVRLKSEFLAIMSHELRTPLNAIEGFTSILLSRLGNVEFNAKTEDFLQRIQTNSRHLIGLINDFLDITRIESGRLNLMQSSFSPRELAESWHVSLGILAEKKGLEFALEIDPDLPLVLHGDVDAITKVTTNLLSNAIKFTDSGKVKLKLSVKADTWQISVQDTGIGIPTEAHGFIFSEFRRVDQSSTREYGGTGLGLAIVHKLVTLMNGTITLESEVGQGSTFTVHLPLSIYMQQQEQEETLRS